MTHPVPSAPLGALPGKGGSSIKKFFLRGLFLLLPTFVTVWILVKGINFLQENVVNYVTKAFAWFFLKVGLVPLEAFENHLRALWIPSEVLAWILCVVAVVLVGMAFGNFIGRRVWTAVENALMGLPPMRFIYPFIKQVTDFFSVERAVGFRQVVAVEYPRKGTYSLGFVTGRAFPAVEEKLQAPCLSVFIPSSPTPMSGYLVFVREDEVIRLSMTMEEAFKMLISGGVIMPGKTEQTSDVADPAGSPATGR